MALARIPKPEAPTEVPELTPAMLAWAEHQQECRRCFTDDPSKLCREGRPLFASALHDLQHAGEE